MSEDNYISTDVHNIYKVENFGAVKIISNYLKKHLTKPCTTFCGRLLKELEYES